MLLDICADTAQVLVEVKEYFLFCQDWDTPPGCVSDVDGSTEFIRHSILPTQILQSNRSVGLAVNVFQT